jgi:hypothetical protein
MRELNNLEVMIVSGSSGMTILFGAWAGFIAGMGFAALSEPYQAMIIIACWSAFGAVGGVIASI